MTIALFVVGGFLLLRLAGGGGGIIDADTRVEVVTTDPVRIVLPIDVDARFIDGRLQQVLADAADTQRDTRAADYLREAAADPRLRTHIANSSQQAFDTGEIGGLAFALYDASVTEADVVIVAVTVELLPTYYGVGRTQAHEDGHWLVNNGVARRCARAVTDAASGAVFAVDAESRIVAGLQRMDERVHTEYHRLVVNASDGRHRVAAREALDAIVGPSCAGAR